MAATNHPILIEQGTTFKLRIRPSSLTLDFTGSTGRGQIRKKYSSPTALATFAVTTGVDATGFYIDYLLTPTDTSAIPVESASDYKKKNSIYCYDLELVMADGRVIRMLEGPATISPEVTKNE